MQSRRYQFIALLKKKNLFDLSAHFYSSLINFLGLSAVSIYVLMAILKMIYIFFSEIFRWIGLTLIDALQIMRPLRELVGFFRIFFNTLPYWAILIGISFIGNQILKTLNPETDNMTDRFLNDKILKLLLWVPSFVYLCFAFVYNNTVTTLLRFTKISYPDFRQFHHVRQSLKLNDLISCIIRLSIFFSTAYIFTSFILPSFLYIPITILYTIATLYTMWMGIVAGLVISLLLNILLLINIAVCSIAAYCIFQCAKDARHLFQANILNEIQSSFSERNDDDTSESKEIEGPISAERSNALFFSWAPNKQSFLSSLSPYLVKFCEDFYHKPGHLSQVATVQIKITKI